MATCLVFPNPAFRQASRRQWAAATVLGFLLPIVVLVTGLDGALGAYPTGKFRVVTVLRALDVVCWVVAFWGIGCRFLGFSNGFLRRASEASLPFYMLHQAVLLPVGYFVVPLIMNPIAKYGIIAVISLAIIFVIYGALVEPHSAVRFLFGMKPRKRQLYPPQAPKPTGWT